MRPEVTPRLAPRGDSELDDFSRDLVAVATGPDVPPAHNLIRTLVWNPGLLRRWIPWGGRLLKGGKLPARLREIGVLRIAVRTGSDYEWSQHVPIALDVGLTREEIDAIAGQVRVQWSEIDGAVIRAIDELVDHARIGEDTWATLASVLKPEQLVELPMLAGHFMSVAYLANSVGIALEPGFEPLPG